MGPKRAKLVSRIRDTVTGKTVYGDTILLEHFLTKPASESPQSELSFAYDPAQFESSSSELSFDYDPAQFETPAPARRTKRSASKTSKKRKSRRRKTSASASPASPASPASSVASPVAVAVAAYPDAEAAEDAGLLAVECRPRGFRNQGNTCFLTVVLQILASSAHFGPWCIANYERATSNFARQFLKTIADARRARTVIPCNRKPMTYPRLVTALNEAHMERGDQDSVTIAYENSMDRVLEAFPVDVRLRELVGHVTTEIGWDGLPRYAAGIGSYYTIPFDHEAQAEYTLEECLAARIRPDRYGNWSRFDTTPDLLCLDFPRMTHTLLPGGGYHQERVMTIVRFPEMFDFGPYLIPPREGVLYTLRGVGIHTGEVVHVPAKKAKGKKKAEPGRYALSGAHYTAYVTGDNGLLYFCNDSVVRLVDAIREEDLPYINFVCYDRVV